MPFQKQTFSETTEEPLNWQQILFMQIRDIEKLRYTDKASFVEAIKGIESLMFDYIENDEEIKNEIAKIKQSMAERLKECPEKKRKDALWMTAFNAENYNKIYMQVLRLIGRHFLPYMKMDMVIE